MQYTATTRNSRYFEVTDEWQHPTGTLSYNIWLPGKAQMITRENNLYDIVSTDFWQVKKAVMRNGLEYALLQANLGGTINIHFVNGQILQFKRKSQWSNGDYILTDETGNTVAGMQADFKWATLTYEYNINIDTVLPDRESNTILPMILVYCARYIRMRGAG